MKGKNFYFEEFKKLIKARKEDTIYGITGHLIRRKPKKIRNALLGFLSRLEDLIQLENLKYSDISLFVIDPNFLFPHRKTGLTLVEGGPTLVISTKGLLYELFQAIDLSKYSNLITRLQNNISELHSIISKNKFEKAEKYKDSTLKIIRKIKKLLSYY